MTGLEENETFSFWKSVSALAYRYLPLNLFQVTQLNLTLAWEQLTTALALITTEIQHHAQEETDTTEDNITAAKLSIKAAEKILSDLTGKAAN